MIRTQNIETQWPEFRRIHIPDSSWTFAGKDKWGLIGEDCGS